MKIPILKLNNMLLSAFQIDLTDRDIIDLQEDLLEKINAEDILGVVIDVSALETIDSYLLNVLSQTAAMIRALGARVVICGIQPGVALSLLDLQQNEVRILTALNLDQGIALLQDLAHEIQT